MGSGCGGDGLTPGKVVDRSELYWALELNHRAVALAPVGQVPYDTLTLVATPRTAEGVPLSGLPAPIYVSADPEKVAVGSDGVLHALASMAPGEMVQVVATLTTGNLTHADTALVTVLDVDPLPVLTTFSIHPIPGKEGYADSAKVGGTQFASSTSDNETTTCFALPTWIQTPPNCQILLPVTVLDAIGAPIPGVPVAFRSSDEETAAVATLSTARHNGRIFNRRRAPASQVTFYASTTVFGIAKADTLPFRIGWPVSATIVTSQVGFSSPVVKVGVGANVFWRSEEPFAIDVNFADPTNVVKLGQPPPSFMSPFSVFVLCQFLGICDDAGNIVLTPNPTVGQTGAVRRFPVPGTYDYSSTVLGVGGRVIVLDER